MRNREATISKAVQAQPRTASGGTAAPRQAASAPNVGPAHGFKSGVAPAKAVPGQAKPAPTSPYRTPLPWDSAYETSVSGANSKYANTLTNIAAQRPIIEQTYGLAPGFDDPSVNPYSRAAVLEESFKRANRGTLGSYGSRGQLYAGSTQNALSYNRDSYGANRDSLDREYRAALQSLTEKEAEAGNTRNTEIGDAGWKRVEAAAGSELDPTTAPEKGRKGKHNGKKGSKKGKGK